MMWRKKKEPMPKCKPHREAPTLRDQLAMAALNSIRPSSHVDDVLIASKAYSIADEMLKNKREFEENELKETLPDIDVEPPEFDTISNMPEVTYDSEGRPDPNGAFVLGEPIIHASFKSEGYIPNAAKNGPIRGQSKHGMLCDDVVWPRE